MQQYLQETTLLNFSDPVITRLFDQQGWHALALQERIKSIYNFVKDDITFGFNVQDNITSTLVLKDTYGQCNTKAILLMSLLRKAGVPCRLHGSTIDKRLQKGVLSGIWYRISPSSIVHTWVEIYYSHAWYGLEGVIVDQQYLRQIQHLHPNKRHFCGFAIATNNLDNLQVYWNQDHTYIQHEGVNADLGIYDSPDEFFKQHAQKIGFVRKLLFTFVVRHSMNKNVRRIRNSI